MTRRTRTAAGADVLAAAAAVLGNEHEVGRWDPLVIWDVARPMMSGSETGTQTTAASDDIGVTNSSTGRSASTLYRKRVRAADAADEPGGYSTAAEATTSAALATPAGLVVLGRSRRGRVRRPLTRPATGTSEPSPMPRGRLGALWERAELQRHQQRRASSERGIAEPDDRDDPVGWIRPTASQNGWRTIVQREVDAYFLHASDNSPMRPAGGGTFNGTVAYAAGRPPTPSTRGRIWRSPTTAPPCGSM